MRNDEAAEMGDQAGHSPGRATAWALGVASFILVTVVLPAEYGIDPTGVGRITGLADMGRPKAVEAKPAAAAEPQSAPAYAARATEAFRFDAVDVSLPPKGEIEYKAVLKEGGAMTYEWDAGAAVLEFDFHGEPSAGPAGAFLSFEKGSASKAAGSLRAPFTGTHGWYWKNDSSSPVVIKLRVAGFHSELRKP